MQYIHSRVFLSHLNLHTGPAKRRPVEIKRKFRLHFPSAVDSTPFFCELLLRFLPTNDVRPPRSSCPPLVASVVPNCCTQLRENLLMSVWFMRFIKAPFELNDLLPGDADRRTCQECADFLVRPRRLLVAGASSSRRSGNVRQTSSSCIAVVVLVAGRELIVDVAVKTLQKTEDCDSRSRVLGKRNTFFDLTYDHREDDAGRMPRYSSPKNEWMPTDTEIDDVGWRYNATSAQPYVCVMHQRPWTKIAKQCEVQSPQPRSENVTRLLAIPPFISDFLNWMSIPLRE